MKTISYTIPRISCNHCAHTIKMEVGDLEGVQSVDVSVDTKFVEIIFSSPATEEKIKKLLTEINYTPNE